MAKKNRIVLENVVGVYTSQAFQYAGIQDGEGKFFYNISGDISVPEIHAIISNRDNIQHSVSVCLDKIVNGMSTNKQTILLGSILPREHIEVVRSLRSKEFAERVRSNATEPQALNEWLVSGYNVDGVFRQVERFNPFRACYNRDQQGKAQPNVVVVPTQWEAVQAALFNPVRAFTAMRRVFQPHRLKTDSKL